MPQSLASITEHDLATTVCCGFYTLIDYEALQYDEIIVLMVTPIYSIFLTTQLLYCFM